MRATKKQNGRCVNCNRTFTCKRRWQKYCSIECGDAVRHRKAYHAAKGLKYAQK